MIVMGDFNAQIRKRTYPMETPTAKFGFELRNERGDRVQHFEYRVSEQSREEMDVEKPKWCNEDRN